jgi:hypothetical protein
LAAFLKRLREYPLHTRFEKTLEKAICSSHAVLYKLSSNAVGTLREIFENSKAF